MSTPIATERLRVARQFEDGGIALMDRVLGINGTAITQSSLSGVTLAIYEFENQQKARAASDGTLVTGQGGSLVVSEVVFNTLQTSAPWTIDSTGYNFRYDTEAGDLPTGNRWYRFEFTLTPTTGAPIPVVWLVEALAQAGS